MCKLILFHGVSQLALSELAYNITSFNVVIAHSSWFVLDFLIKHCLNQVCQLTYNLDFVVCFLIFPKVKRLLKDLFWKVEEILGWIRSQVAYFDTFWTDQNVKGTFSWQIFIWNTQKRLERRKEDSSWSNRSTFIWKFIVSSKAETILKEKLYLLLIFK